MARFSDSSKGFNNLIQRYPYFSKIEYASILRIYSKYKQGRLDEIESLTNDFFMFYPGSKYLSYAAYVAGMSQYKQARHVMWDQKNLNKAKEIFIRLARLFPTSDYALDALLKLELIRNQEAFKILQIGLFYQSKPRNYAAAISRYNSIVLDYPRTLHVRQALYRLVESYISLGLNEEAHDSALVLGYNFPESRWYYRAYDLMFDRGLISGIEK